MIIDGTGASGPSSGAAYFDVIEPGGEAAKTDGAGCFSFGIGAPTPTALLTVQRSAAATPAKVPLLNVTAAADTALTLNTEYSDVLFDLSATRTWATGSSIGTQRSFRIVGPTIAFVGASTLDYTAALHVVGPQAGTNATLSNTVGIWCQGQFHVGPATVKPSATGAAISLGFTALATPAAGYGGTLCVTAPAHTACTASTEIIDFKFDGGRILQYGTGTLAAARSMFLNQPTIAFVGASTCTNAATLAIGGAPIAGTNCTFGTAAGQGSYALWIQGGGALITGHVSQAGGSAPGAAAGANNGGSPPAPVVTAGSNDSRGNLTFGSGSAAAAGAQCVVTFNATYGAAPYVDLMAGNSVTQALGLYVSSISATGFTISSTNAPTSSQANTTFSVYWFVVG